MSFPWPPIDGEVESAVASQLHATVSIYDRSGVIARFEDAFAARHNAAHALVTSSGTTALHSAYYALGIGPGDEVLVQDYTFFATAMPLFQLGAVPVLVDVDDQASIDLDQAATLVTDTTRALVATHMWGNPQDMVRLRRFCDQRGLALIEDCSHAHGATRNRLSVGELADAACWSLQGKKTITAGEAGILTTRHREVYDRAQLLGHFNKRALAEIAQGSPLHRFAETGLGLKYRAHPLGLAMAEVYLNRLDAWLEHRRQQATRLEKLLHTVPGIRVLTPTGDDRSPTFYAFVFLVDPETAGFTRQELIAPSTEAGATDIEAPTSMRPLHTYPIFAAPRSPVTTYRASPIRADMPGAERLTEQAVRVPLPAEDNSASRAYMNSLTAGLTTALQCLAGVRLV